MAFAAALASAMPAVISHSDRGMANRGRLPCVTTSVGGVGTGMVAASRARTAPPKNAERQPSVTPTTGTAKPPRAVAEGIAACLNPKASPRRAAGTPRARARLAAGWMIALPTPARARRAPNTSSWRASTAMSTSDTALTQTPIHSARWEPSRSARRPPYRRQRSGRGGRRHADADPPHLDAQVRPDQRAQPADQRRGEHADRRAGQRAQGVAPAAAGWVAATASRRPHRGYGQACSSMTLRAIFSMSGRSSRPCRAIAVVFRSARMARRWSSVAVRPSCSSASETESTPLPLP